MMAENCPYCNQELSQTEKFDRFFTVKWHTVERQSNYGIYAEVVDSEFPKLILYVPKSSTEALAQMARMIAERLVLEHNQLIESLEASDD